MKYVHLLLTAKIQKYFCFTTFFCKFAAKYLVSMDLGVFKRYNQKEMEYPYLFSEIL